MALMGPSGSGKSTLLNLLAGIDRPTRGTVRIGGTEISSLSERALATWRARHIGFIFQLYNLIPVLTAFENVELPLLLTNLSKAQRREHVMTALGIVGLADRDKHYPRQLSGGQEQRVAIARAIVTDPTLLLADEPTGDLDAKSAAEMLTLLQRLNEEFKKTIVMVTHDPHAAERAVATCCTSKRAPSSSRWCRRMKFIGLVLKSARRSKRRTALTMISVALAVFLFSSLRAVLDGFDAVSAASSSTRMVTIRSTSMIFSMPTSHAELDQGHARRAGHHLGELVRRHLQGSEELLRSVRGRSGKLPAHVSGDHRRRRRTVRRSSTIAPAASSATVWRRSTGFKVGDKLTLQVGIPCTDHGTSTSPSAASITRAAPRSTTSR